jgi:gamma-glutamylcyclotransferase (GGCT)/AIG2-like uncharacterized protein YtfP
MESSADRSLFVYGNLLDASLRERLLHHPVRTVAARLAGYERRRDRYFYVARHAERDTPGLVMLDLGPADFELLDRYEAVPRWYTRERIEVADAEGHPLACWIYLPTARLLGG